MSKEQIVADAKAALLAGQDSLLTQVFGDVADKSALEQKASDGTLTQADVDAAVAAQKAADQVALDAAIAQDAADVAAGQKALGEAQVALADSQKALADMTAKEQLEESAVADVKTKIDQVQASFDAIKALFNPAP